MEHTPPDRIEMIREIVDEILVHMSDPVERRCAYVHLYGVAQACAMLALKRGENTELAIIAGMLHDIATYKTMNSADHAHKSAEMAQEIMEGLPLFTPAETDAVCAAIYAHSDKHLAHPALTEILIDADVLQHCIYNPFLPVSVHERDRFEKLKKEFGLGGV